MKKEKIIETINELPQEFELDDLIERLILIEKIEKGLVQLEKNETKSHEEVKELVKTWQK
jgi:hypothetical protein